MHVGGHESKKPKQNSRKIQNRLAVQKTIPGIDFNNHFRELFCRMKASGKPWQMKA